jgi:hypothetical protein
MNLYLWRQLRLRKVHCRQLEKVTFPLEFTKFFPLLGHLISFRQALGSAFRRALDINPSLSERVAQQVC